MRQSACCRGKSDCEPATNPGIDTCPPEQHEDLRKEYAMKFELPPMPRRALYPDIDRQCQQIREALRKEEDEEERLWMVLFVVSLVMLFVAVI